MIDKYEDMYELPHHQSTRHPHMSLLSRAAQFSPFAALTGFDGMIDDEEKINNAKPSVLYVSDEGIDEYTEMY